MKKIYIPIVIGLIIIVAGVIFFNREEENKIPEISQEDISIKKEASLIIDYGDGNSQTFNVEFTEKMTAFDLLNSKSEELTLETKTYEMGVFVEAIGDKKNGEDGKYWMYYINEEMPMVSADNYQIDHKDKVEFKFEKSFF